MRRHKTLLERFMSKVNTSGHCWLWTGSLSSNGYGKIKTCTPPGWKDTRATHVAWFLGFGVWPSNFVCHTCDNPLCVKVSHLFLGTATDNRQDAIKKGRQAGLTPDRIHLVLTSTGSQKSIAKKVGINQSSVSRIRKRHAQAKKNQIHG